MNKAHLAVLMALVALIALPMTALAQDAGTAAELCEAAPAGEPETREFEAAEQILEEGVDYRAIFCTDAGPIYVDLFEEQTPITVNSFVFLAEQGYYNNSVFHRVLPGFMAQGGDPVGSPKGTGGPGYEFVNEASDDLVFDVAGKLAMANAGPDTNGSQFFITTAAADFLNGGYSLFGEVITGQAIAENIQLRDPNYSPDDAPATGLKTILIITDSATVSEDEPIIELAEQADFERVIASFPTEVIPVLEQFGQGFSTIMAASAETGIRTAEDLQAHPDAAIAGFYQEHAPLYAADADVQLLDCANTISAFPISDARYHIDVYETPDAAGAALEAKTGIYLDWEPVETAIEGTSVFRLDVAACNGADAYNVSAVRQSGRFVITTNFTYLPEGINLPDESVSDVLLDEFAAFVFETALRSVLAPEIR